MKTKEGDKEFVTCMQCQHATLMQWFENPIVAQCAKKGDRQVAQSNRICKEFRQSTAEANIQHFDHYEDEF